LPDHSVWALVSRRAMDPEEGAVQSEYACCQAGQSPSAALDMGMLFPKGCQPPPLMLTWNWRRGANMERDVMELR
jgi:hypothetical protein